MLSIGTKVRLLSEDEMTGSLATVMGYYEDDYILVFNSYPSLVEYYPAMVVPVSLFEEVTAKEQEIIARLSALLDEVPNEQYTADVLLSIIKWAEAKIKTTFR